MRFPFDSAEAQALNREIFATMYFAALTASNELAKVCLVFGWLVGWLVAWRGARHVCVRVCVCVVVAIAFISRAYISSSAPPPPPRGRSLGPTRLLPGRRRRKASSSLISGVWSRPTGGTGTRSRRPSSSTASATLCSLPRCRPPPRRRYVCVCVCVCMCVPCWAADSAAMEQTKKGGGGMIAVFFIGRLSLIGVLEPANFCVCSDPGQQRVHRAVHLQHLPAARACRRVRDCQQAPDARPARARPVERGDEGPHHCPRRLGPGSAGVRVCVRMCVLCVLCVCVCCVCQASRVVGNGTHCARPTIGI